MEAVAAILGGGVGCCCNVPNPASAAEDVQLGLAFPGPLLLVVAVAIAAVGIHRGMDGETPPVEVRQDLIFLPVDRRGRG